MRTHENSGNLGTSNEKEKERPVNWLQWSEVLVGRTVW
jgi:hypothetical protein